MRTRDLAITAPIMDAGCQRIRREITRVGSPATRAELRAVVQSYRRYVANGGSVPVMWNGSDDSRDVMGDVVDLYLVGDRLMGVVQSCGLHDIKSARQSRWTATIAEDFKDGRGNLYPLFMLRLNVQTPSPPTPQRSNNLSLPSKENQMARNYSLVKRHILPSRKDWMRANVPPNKLPRSLAVTTAESDTISIADCVRWINMLASYSPDLAPFVISKVPATASELRTTMDAIEGILKKFAGDVGDAPPPPPDDLPDGITLQNLRLPDTARNRALRELSLQIQNQRLFNRCVKNHTPYSDLSEQDQDARQRSFWGGNKG